MSDAARAFSDATDLDDDEPVDRRAEILDELAELGLAMARAFQAGALTAATPQDAGALSNAFARTARTVRQCIALAGKREQDEFNRDRIVSQDARAEVKVRIARRRAAVMLEVDRRIIVQPPPPDDLGIDADKLIQYRMEDLRDRLDERLLDAGFLHGTFDDAVERLCAELGLEPPPAAPDEPGAPAAFQPDDDADGEDDPDDDDLGDFGDFGDQPFPDDGDEDEAAARIVTWTAPPDPAPPDPGPPDPSPLDLGPSEPPPPDPDPPDPAPYTPPWENLPPGRVVRTPGDWMGS